jgi:uncharacterized membrane protein
VPNLGPYHPQLVHFVVALGIAGVVLRLISLTRRVVWTGPAAAALLLTVALASVLAVQSGLAAHGVAERIPGAREAVQAHEEAGEWARNLFLVLAVLEIAALVFRSRERVQRGLLIASGVLGLATGLALYKAADRGGQLVYSYAGGVGTRSGDPADVRRLLVAGLYQEIRVARDSMRFDEAARLTDELARQAPNDPVTPLLVAESQLRDRKDPRAALATLATVQTPPDNRFLVIRKGLLASDAWVAAGQADSARAILTGLAARFPHATMVADALRRLP